MRRPAWPWGPPSWRPTSGSSVPAAKSGIAAAVVLGVGRAIGEAMAIMMVAGNVANMPSLLSSVKFLTTAIASEMSYAAVGSLQRNALYSIGLVLFLFIMLHQRAAERVPETGKGGMSYEQRHEHLEEAAVLPARALTPPPHL